MRIRSLWHSDREPLIEALEASFNVHEIEVAVELLDAAIAGSDDYWILVADQLDGAPESIGGYICYGPTPMTRSTFDLYWIATHPAVRGRGVGSALIRGMEAELTERGVTGIRVETSETEGFGAAQRLYQRHGYPEAARLPDFYRPGDSLILYYKRLS